MICAELLTSVKALIGVEDGDDNDSLYTIRFPHVLESVTRVLYPKSLLLSIDNTGELISPLSLDDEFMLDKRLVPSACYLCAYLLSGDERFHELYCSEMDSCLDNIAADISPIKEVM